MFFWSVWGLTALGQVLVLGARAGEGQELTSTHLLPFAVWTVSAAGLCLGLRLIRFSGSTALVGGVLALSGLGVVVRGRMSGVSPGVVDMQWWIQPLGFLWLWLACAFSRKGASERWRPLWGLAFAAAFALSAGMLALGVRYRGGLYAPGGTTPAEALKLFLPFALAGFFTQEVKAWKGRPPWWPPGKSLMLLTGLWLALCAMLVMQRDFGLVLLLSLSLLGLVICATGRSSWGVLAIGVTIAAGVGVVRWFPHGARRVESWMDPFADPTGAGWQVLQALSGLYAGGLAGIGLGSGRPDRLPIASSDFVYAVYGEETGYMGSLLLLALFAHLLRAGVRITRSQDPGSFGYFLAAGLTVSLAAQVVVNIGGVVGLLPVTGIPLPYISQGGSSFWVISVQFGLLLGLSEQVPRKKKGKRRNKKS